MWFLLKHIIEIMIVALPIRIEDSQMEMNCVLGQGGGCAGVWMSSKRQQTLSTIQTQGT